MKRGVSLLLLLGMLLPGAIAPAWEEEPGTFGTWLVYWDVSDGLYDLREWETDIHAVVYFAAYFDNELRLFIPDEIALLREGVEALPDRDPPVALLSVTNDRLYENGDAAQKDTALLWGLFADEASRAAHARELVDLALGGGYDGLEVDYEGLGTDMDLWAGMLAFLRQLSALAGEAGLSLRVLLEAGAPFAQLDFPPELSYLVMCYNLYGLHSGPGPKATPGFLRQIVQKTASLPGRWGYAIASGGFDWTEEGEAVDITYREGWELLDYYGATPERDPDSGCLSFSYVDEAGARHEVWMADDLTLEMWREVLREAGDPEIDLWRMGGNTP